MVKQPVYRVIDANFNRAREGLRVCEEFARFFLNDKTLTEEFKKTRRSISRICNDFLSGKKLLFLARDAAKDVGKKAFAFEMERDSASDVFWANLQRSKEALRVLEEFLKLVNKGFSDDFRKLRYKLYEIEKRSFQKLRDLL